MIRRSDLQTEDLTTGELFLMDLNCPVWECCPDWLLPGRDLQIDGLKRDLEQLRAELERIKAEVAPPRPVVCFRQEEV